MGRLAQKAIAAFEALSPERRRALVDEAILAARQSLEAWPSDAWLAGGVVDMALESKQTVAPVNSLARDGSNDEPPRGTRYSSATPSHFIYRPAA